MHNSPGRVLVIGGSGFYGKYLVADLLKHTHAAITIASRRPHPTFTETSRVILATCDLNNLPRLTQLAGECDVLVHCAGPFQHLPLNPLHAAIAAKCHYVDLSEDRLFARKVRELAPQINAAGITALSGASICPAMESLFARLLQPRFASIGSIRTIAAPDTRKHRGPAMFYTMLWGVGRGWDQPRNGKLQRVYGWTEPEWIEFPPPVGKRLTFLVLEMANLDHLPETFSVGTVAFKAGTEHWWLNRILNFSALFRARTGFPQWERFGPFVRAMSWLAGRFGNDEGGVVFEVGGIEKGNQTLHRVALMADKDGGFIPFVLAAIVTDRILTGRLNQRGLLPVHRWIDPAQLVEGLLARELTLWWQESPQHAWKQTNAII